MPVEYAEDITIFENDIDYWINSFCDDFNISDLKDISQSVWNGLLMYVNKHYIKPSKILKTVPVKADRIGLYHNEYDIELCDKLCDYYIYLCRIYDKECSIVGFGYLSGINTSIIYEWSNDYKGQYKASPQRNNIAKKLQAERENSLSDKLLTGKNPVGVLGILNHFYGWSGVGNMKEDTAKQSATLSDVRKNTALLSDNLSNDPAENTDNTPLELCDNSTQLENQ